MNIGTFHSVCAKIISRAVAAGGYGAWRILDQSASLKQVNECVESMGVPPVVLASFRKVIGRKVPACHAVSGVARVLHEFISMTKRSTAVTRREFVSFCERVAADPKHKFNWLLRTDVALGFVVGVRTLYHDKLKSGRSADFEDLVYEATRIISEPDAQVAYEGFYRYVLVDEFQDVSLAEYKFVRTLCKSNQNLFCVGDDDQSIYGWRQSDVGIIRTRFAEDYPEHRRYQRAMSRRCSSAIVAGAESLIRHDKHRLAKVPLVTCEDECSANGGIALLVAQDPVDEACQIAMEIKSAVARGERRYSDFAVLSRNNEQLDLVECAFGAEKLPYHRSVGFYSLPEVETAINCLKYVCYPDADVVRRIAALVHANAQCRTLGKTGGRSQARAVSPSVGHGLPTQGKCPNALREILTALNDCRGLRSVGEQVGLVVQTLIERFCCDDLQTSNLLELNGLASSFTFEYDGRGLPEFLDYLEFYHEGEHETLRPDAIKLSTIHSAKGLGFPVVYVVGVEEGILPSHRPPYRFDEERRVLYVAMTRAVDGLILSYCRSRNGRKAQLSRFIREIGTDHLHCRYSTAGGELCHKIEELLIRHHTRIEETLGGAVTGGLDSAADATPIAAIGFPITGDEMKQVRSIRSQLNRLLPGTMNLEYGESGYRLCVLMPSSTTQLVARFIGVVLGAITGRETEYLTSTPSKFYRFGKDGLLQPSKRVHRISLHTIHRMTEHLIGVESVGDLVTTMKNGHGLGKIFRNVSKAEIARTNLQKRVDSVYLQPLPIKREIHELVDGGWVFNLKEAYPNDFEYRLRYRLGLGVSPLVARWRISNILPEVLDGLEHCQNREERFPVGRHRRDSKELRRKLSDICNDYREGNDSDGLRRIRKPTRDKLVECVCYALDLRDAAIRRNKDDEVIVLSQDMMIENVPGVDAPPTHLRMMQLMVRGYTPGTQSLGVFYLVSKGSSRYTQKNAGVVSATRIALSDEFRHLLDL